jgi:biotin carboxylase
VSTAGGLPLLAIVHNADSVSSFDLAEAATGVCQILFVLDGDPSMVRLLHHFGPVTDITGMDGPEAAARVRALEPDGIATFIDALLLRTAALADVLGLPFHAPDVASTLVDKYRQRLALQDAGLPGPRFRRIDSGDVLPEAFAQDLDFPVVVKPQAGAASRETTLAGDREQLVDAVARASAAGIGAVVVEEYLPDSEATMAPDYASFVSVESVMGAGRLRHLAVTGKFPLAPPFRESGHFTPSQLPPETVTEVLDTVGAAVLGIGITVGGLHTEVKLTPAGPRIIEVNGRTGGAVPEVLTAAGGCSLLEAAMRVALGQAPGDGGLSPCARVGYRINVQPPMWAHVVHSIEGLEALSELPGVLAVNLLRNPGDAVDWRLGSDEQVLHVIGAVDDLDELRAVRHRIGELVSVSYD